MSTTTKINRYAEILKTMSLDAMLNTFVQQQVVFSSTYDEDCVTQMNMIRDEIQNRIDA